MFPLSLLSYGAVDVDEVGDVGDAGHDYMMRAMLLGHSVVVLVMVTEGVADGVGEQGDGMMFSGGIMVLVMVRGG